MQSNKTTFGTITKLQWAVRTISYAIVIAFIVVAFSREMAWSGVMIPLYCLTLLPVLIAWGYPSYGGAISALFAGILFVLSLVRRNNVSPTLPFNTIENLLILLLLICGLMYLSIGYLKHKTGML